VAPPPAPWRNYPVTGNAPITPTKGIHDEDRCFNDRFRNETTYPNHDDQR